MNLRQAEEKEEKIEEDADEEVKKHSFNPCLTIFDKTVMYVYTFCFCFVFFCFIIK